MENAPGRPAQATEPPDGRLSRLSQAISRINESLDVDTALRAVMEGARSLTGAPYAVITTLDESGRVEDHLVLAWTPATWSGCGRPPVGPGSSST